jgi:conjugative relaxase-like TrwC/TraI family protein
MLSITPSENYASAAKYYYEEMSRADYLSGRGAIKGRVHGIGAQALGLPETLTSEQYTSLLGNVNPVTGEQITDRMHPDRSPGTDFTFGTPKTFAMLYERFCRDGRDEDAAALLKAHEAAVHFAMGYVEQDIQAQVNEADGKHYTRTTGNCVYVTFPHFDARPVDGVADRFVHTHAYLLNLTEDREGGKWKAVDLYQTMLDRVYYQALYFQHLGNGMQALGYELERQSTSFELAGVSRETIDKFSRRSGQVRERAEQLGATSAKAKRKLATVTRAGKDEGLSEEATRQAFFDRQTDEEKALIGYHADQTGKPVAPKGPSANDAIDFAIRDAFARKSVVNLKRFYEKAIMHAVTAGHTLEDIEEAARKKNGLIFGHDKFGNDVVTTVEARDEEQKLREFVQGQSVPSFVELRTKKGLPEYAVTREWLADEQKAAVHHVMTSTDRVVGIRGGAGTGKTTAMEETVEAIEAASGKKVVVVAPTTTASHGTLVESGFTNAETIAKLLFDRELQKQAKGGIIYVDEAGLVGAPTMRKLFELSDRLGARVILQGDSRQHPSVERGDALRYIEEHAGLKFAQLKEIRRQEHPGYKAAVESFQSGDVAEGFGKLRDLGWVHEIKDGSIHETLARDYLDALDKAPKNAPRHKVGIIIATTHKEGEDVTDAVRKGLRDRGKLGPEKGGLERLVAETNWTPAQQEESHRYQKGHVIEFTQNADGGFTKGDRLYVRGVVAGEVIVSATKDGKAKPLAVRELADRFQVYRQREFQLAVGDVVRLTQGGKDADGERLNRNARYIVQGFDEHDRVLLGTKTPPTTVAGPVAANIVRRIDAKQAMHLAHGYAMTSHASQSMSVDYVFASLTSETFMAMSREQAYVTESRGKKASYVYTNDYDGMVAAAERSGARMFASEVKASRKPAIATRVAPVPATAGRPAVAVGATRVATKPQAPQKKGIAAAWTRIHEKATALMQAAFGLRQRENLALAALALGVEPSRMPERAQPARPVVGKYTRLVQQPKAPDLGHDR